MSTEAMSRELGLKRDQPRVQVFDIRSLTLIERIRVQVRAGQFLVAFFAIAFFAWSPHPVLGQTNASADENSPEKTALRAMEALRENRVGDFAEEMHPEALKSFKTAILDVMDSAEKAGREGELLSLFEDVTAVSDLRKLDDKAFFESFYKGVIKMQPRIRDSMKGMTIEVIGHVKEGADMLHVVYRGTVNSGDLKISQLSVMSMKKSGERWGMLLTNDLEALAATLKKQF